MSAESNVHIRGKSDKPVYKIITIGEPSVGKTSLIKKFVKNQIDDEYLPTVGASISKQPAYIMDSEKKVPISMLLWDIAGQEQFNLLHKVYYKGSKGVVIVFDLTSPATLASVKKWKQDTATNEISDVPIVLVGNKSDLAGQVKVTPPQIQEMMAATGIKDYFETSAMTGKNVHEFFNKLAERIYFKK